MITRWIICAIAVFQISYESGAQVVINEVSASNYDHTQDSFGRYEDWIELHNTSGTAIDLGGYYLSDRTGNNTKWQIPAGCVIAPFGFQLFYCSGKDLEQDGEYHTNFRLTQCRNEPAVFSNPAASIIDVFQYNELSRTMRNHSRGRVSDGAADWGLFMQPTPGAPNSTQVYQNYPRKPQLSHQAGFYQANLSISMSTDLAGASIYYTLDGSTPSSTSQLYTGPVTLNETTVVRAIVLHPDALIPDGFIETNTYFINESFTVPVVSVSGDDLLILLNGLQIEPVGHFEVFDQNGIFRDEGLGEYNKHGNDSWAYQQRGLDWITRDQFGYNNEIDYRIFRGKSRRFFQRFILKAGANCNYPFEAGGAHIRDLYVQSLSQVADLELDERSGEFCIVFANGQYWGLYDIREKVDDHDFTDFYYEQDRFDIDFIKTWGGTWEEYGSIADWNTLRDFVLNNDMTDPANYALVSEQYNTLSLIDYFVMNSYVVAADWLNWNTAWWRGRNPQGGAQKWRYILWDMDAVFGHYVNYTGIPNTGSGADICFPEALNDPGGQGHVPMWNKLIENEDFQAQYINRMSDLSNSFFSCAFMTQHLDSLVNLMLPEMPKHIERWGGTMQQWQSNLQSIYDFIDVRCAELNDNIMDCYEWVDGPYEVTVHVQPQGAGTVRVNTITPPAFPFTGTYFGGISQNYQAQPGSAFSFSHWEVDGAVIAPDSLSAIMSFTLSQNATITAHFAPKFFFDMTLSVMPEGAGTIAIDNEIYDSFPQVASLPAGVALPLQGINAPGYRFDRWEISIPNQVNPSLTEPNATLNIAFNGQLRAIFVENNNAVIFDVEPAGVGSISLNGEELLEYPALRSLPSDFVYQLDAQAMAPFWRFSHWQTLLNPLQVDSSISALSMEFYESDAVTAFFRETPNYNLTFVLEPKEVDAAIRFGNQIIRSFPHTERYPGNVAYQLEPIVPHKWEFKGWHFVFRPDFAGRFYPNVQFTPDRNDTIILRMEERFNMVYIPSAFSPNGDGVNETIGVQGPEIAKEDFEWVIYSRMGDMVFRTNDIDRVWNGSMMNNGFYCPPGVYSYYLKYKNAITTDNETKSGSIMLIR